MELKRGIEVDAGVVQGFIFGGPYRKYIPGTRRLIGVKMAAEVNHPYDVSIPTQDFDVPAPDILIAGIKETLTSIANGNDAYVGCMGGIGRTGLFMGVLAKAVAEFNGVARDPVAYVRASYLSHTIETEQQVKFVRDFDTRPIVVHLAWLNERKVQYIERGWFASIAKLVKLVRDSV